MKQATRYIAENEKEFRLPENAAREDHEYRMLLLAMEICNLEYSNVSKEAYSVVETQKALLRIANFGTFKAARKIFKSTMKLRDDLRTYLKDAEPPF